MVLKSSKSGVYSGNTLRASNSRYNRLYRTQSCIVRRLVNKDGLKKSRLKKLLKNDDVHSFDVEFSLNKKERWDLPEFLTRYIQSYEPEEEVKTDLLVRHKLKRQANCIAYYSNKGPLKRLVPQTGRYFNGKCATDFKTSPQKKKRGKQTAATNGSEDNNQETSDTEPTIRYEVVYPCKQTSSIVHNRKYIIPEEEGTGTNLGKGKHRKKRARLTTRDVNEILEYSDPRYDNSFSDDTSGLDVSGEMDMHPPIRVTLQDFLTPSTKQRRKSKRRVRHEEDYTHTKKSQVVHMNPSFQSEATTDEERRTKSVTISPPEPTLVKPKSVLMYSDEFASDSLKRKFGKSYQEGKCQPRKVIIDISEDVRSYIKQSKYFKDCIPSDFYTTSYIVFTEHGLSREGSHLGVFDVQLNFPSKMNSIMIETLSEMDTYTIEGVTRKCLGYLDTLPREAFLERSVSNMYSEPDMIFELTSKANNWNICTLHPVDMPANLTDLKACPDTSHLDTTGSFCNICYEEIAIDNRVNATCLDVCGHWFCNSCWRDHLVNKLQDGSKSFTCPEYGCSADVDFPTLLSFLHINDIKKHTERQLSEQINVSPRAKWCPVPSCGHAILNKGTEYRLMNIVCKCGTNLCFACLKNAHWPATCQQAKCFREKIIALKDYVDLPKDFFFEPLPDAVLVEGKSCPVCKRFIEKLSGCPNMKCPCGTNFCWNCVKATLPYEEHRCVPEDQTAMLLEEKEGGKRQKLKRTRFYDMAIEHRQLSRYAQTFKYRSACFCLSKDIGICATKDQFIKKQITELPQHMDNWTFQRTACKFLMNMLNIKIELHHVIENTAIILDCTTAASLRFKLIPVLNNMIDCASTLGAILESRQVQDASRILFPLKASHHKAQMCINRVSKIMRNGVLNTR